MFILLESCSPCRIVKNYGENIFMVCLQTAGLKRETGRQLHPDLQGAATGEGSVMHTT